MVIKFLPGCLPLPIALYIHVPFCIKKCFYCDFTSYPVDPGAVEAYLDALSQEINLYGADLPEGEKVLSSLFVGGGTPTCLPAKRIKEVLEDVRSGFKLLPGCEVTVEANPGTVDLDGLLELKAAGVNRLSIGVQSFQDSLLQTLGRIHSAGEAVKAVRLAREAGFSNLNLDLIFGIPGQTIDDWRETLAIAVDLAPEHIAAYGLQIEKGTPLERAVARGELETCPEETELSMFLAAIDYLPTHAYKHYEISNFARPGRECIHNLVYWLNRPYLGLGPAAHSCLRNERFNNESLLEKYLEKLSREEYPVETRVKLSGEIQMSDTMLLGLRLTGGVDLDSFYRGFGKKVEDIYRKELAGLMEMKLIELGGGFLRLTRRGLPVANYVFRQFV